MEKILILNGSPRAPRSNSKEYAQIFASLCPLETEYCNITRSNHLDLCHKLEEYSQVLFVFPLYADGVPVTLLRFLNTLEDNLPQNRPVVSVLINCGFLEPEQNDVAVKIMRLYCKKTGLPFGSVLEIGSGEAILSTPFRFFVRRKMKKLVASMVKQNNRSWKVTMPISKGMFLKASTAYWENYGKKNGLTKEEMSTMEIES